MSSMEMAPECGSSLPSFLYSYVDMDGSLDRARSSISPMAVCGASLFSDHSSPPHHGSPHLLLSPISPSAPPSPLVHSLTPPSLMIRKIKWNNKREPGAVLPHHGGESNVCACQGIITKVTGSLLNPTNIPNTPQPVPQHRAQYILSVGTGVLLPSNTQKTIVLYASRSHCNPGWSRKLR